MSVEATLRDSIEPDVFCVVLGDWDATWRKFLSSGSGSRLDMDPSETRLWELSLWSTHPRQELIFSDLFVKQSDCLETHRAEVPKKRSQPRRTANH